MAVSGTWRDPVLINTVGHTAGILLFGLIIALLIRDWRTHGVRRTNLSLVAALLALGWNIGSLVVLGSRYPASSRIVDLVATASFSMLSLLPAVLFQVAVQGQHRLLVASGYLVSGCAIILHFLEPFSDTANLHHAGLVCIVLGFGVLTITAFLLGRKQQGRGPEERSEWISLGCLLLFTTSFLHFGYQHFSSSPWAAEVAWHHIGIPVALIVLLSDYRFLLLDTFIRFLTNIGLAAVYIAVVLVVSQKFRLWDLIRPSMFLTGITLVALCLLLISFAYVKNSLQAWVSRVVFRRQSVDNCARAIVKLASAARSEEDLLTQAGQQIADHLEAERFAIAAQPRDNDASSRPSVLFGDDRNGLQREDFHPKAQLPLRFSSGDARCLILGSRRGGRNYRGDDLDDMQHLGATVVEQVERFRAEELRRLVNQAELRALQAQINPHFLFNALNTLYGTIDRGSRDARRMVINLAEIFRYFLRGDRNLIPLSEELRIVEAYLEIEALRLGDRLETELAVSDSLRSTLIPVLSIQPLVENAVKHGLSTKQGSCRVSVTTEKVSAGLLVTVADTGVGFEQSKTGRQEGTGLGLENVRRRLSLCYGSSAELKIQSSSAGTIVSFLIPDPPQLERTAAELRMEADPLTG